MFSLNVVASMSEHDIPVKPVKKRQRRKTKDNSSSKLTSKMATSVSANVEMKKGLSSAGSQEAAGSNVSKPTASSAPFPSFPFPGPSVPASNFYTNPMAQQADYNSKIDYIISKVGKLDAIEAQQVSILSRLSVIEVAVADNKKMIELTNSKIATIEKSQEFMSGQYDVIDKSVKDNKRDTSKIQDELKGLSKENEKLRKSNAALEDDIIDLKCRSMRDNLVFLGIPEPSNPIHTFSGLAHGSANIASGGPVAASADNNEGERMETTGPNNQPDGSGNVEQPRSPRSYAQAVASEDCVGKVLDFCEHVLHKSNPREHILIDRAHRMGAFNPNKTRNIVVKFKDTASKMLVKSALQNVNLRGSPYAVFEQFPPVVQECRKALIPEMVKARREGKKAALVRDKLYINNKLFEPEGPGNSA